MRVSNSKEHIHPGVGKRLHRARLAKKLTQRDLATKGVSYAFISRIESGERIPTMSALVKIAKRLDVTAQYLATGKHGVCPYCEK